MTFDPELEVARRAWENYEHHLAFKVAALQAADDEAGRVSNPVAVRQAAEEACAHLRPANCTTRFVVRCRRNRRRRRRSTSALPVGGSSTHDDERAGADEGRRAAGAGA